KSMTYFLRKNSLASKSSKEWSILSNYRAIQWHKLTNQWVNGKRFSSLQSERVIASVNKNLSNEKKTNEDFKLLKKALHSWFEQNIVLAGKKISLSEVLGKVDSMCNSIGIEDKKVSH
ncbi:MAG: hypothetical protein MHPSP_004302, partial [Paramarteilia canceri]